MYGVLIQVKSDAYFDFLHSTNPVVHFSRASAVCSDVKACRLMIIWRGKKLNQVGGKSNIYAIPI